MTPSEATLHRTALLESALHCARQGWPVFPLYELAAHGRCACGQDCGNNAGKHPRTEHGLHDATTDPDRIRTWWTQWPDANLGLVTGPPSRLLVLDVDPAKNGNESLQALLAQHGPLPVTPEAVTGGGGRHLLFSYPDDGAVKNSTSLVGPGLDVRGLNGYVVAAPSRHRSGRGYGWARSRHPDMMGCALAPEWLLRRMRTPPVSTNGDGTRSAEDWAALLQGAPEGQRHAVLCQIAGHYLGLKIAPAEVEEIVLGVAARCRPPHDPADVRRVVQDFAAKDAAREAEGAAPDAEGLGLTPLGDMLAEPDETHAWVVEGRLPAGGLGLLAGKPKAGKSTAARGLALAVSRGAPWLGFATTPGPVIYLALEEKRAEVRAHFRAMGATTADPIHVLCAAAPADALARLRVEAARVRPVLIIVDPLFRFVRVPDGNDYATMTAALEPLMVLARETGAHVLLVHHLGKGERLGADAILGSTAIFGAVDTALLMRRGEKYRTLESVQRYGGDLEEVTLSLDPVTRTVTAGVTRAEAEHDEAARVVLEFLGTVPAPVTEAQLEASIECRTRLQRAALRSLVATGQVLRMGRGGKADPFVYAAGTRIPEGASA